MKHTLYGIIENNQIRYHHKRQHELTMLAFKEGTNVQVTISDNPKRKPRTNKQNAYYWSVVVPMIADACGYEDYEHDCVHEEMKRKFNPVSSKISGEVIGGSTKKMTTIENSRSNLFSKYE